MRILCGDKVSILGDLGKQSRSPLEVLETHLPENRELNKTTWRAVVRNSIQLTMQETQVPCLVREVPHATKHRAPKSVCRNY